MNPPSWATTKKNPQPQPHQHPHPTCIPRTMRLLFYSGLSPFCCCFFHSFIPFSVVSWWSYTLLCGFIVVVNPPLVRIAHVSPSGGLRGARSRRWMRRMGRIAGGPMSPRIRGLRRCFFQVGLPQVAFLLWFSFQAQTCLAWKEGDGPCFNIAGHYRR